MKGKLKVIFLVRWEFFINGELKMVKDVLEDSIFKVVIKEVVLCFEFEMDYEIVIKLFLILDDKIVFLLKCELVKDDKFKEVVCSIDFEQKYCFLFDNIVYGNCVIVVFVLLDGKYLLICYWDNYLLKCLCIYCELIELKIGKVLFINLRDGM